jgi:hypothetical protein
MHAMLDSTEGTLFVRVSLVIERSIGYHAVIVGLGYDDSAGGQCCEWPPV